MSTMSKTRARPRRATKTAAHAPKTAARATRAAVRTTAKAAAGKSRTATARRRAGGEAAPAIPDVLVKATATADVVDAPARTALAIDGSAVPGSEPVQRSIGALYGLAYTLKFARKAGGRPTFKVPPLEGRWWAEGWNDEAAQAPRETWRWRLRIGVPADVTEAELRAAVEQVTTKKGGKLEGSAEPARVRLERIPPQRLGRVLHVGSYAEEARSFAAIAAALDAAGLVPAHSHLEVYLADPGRTKPEKLRTVVLRELSGG